MPSTCEFKLNKPNGVYQSGDTISGVILLNTTSAKDVKGIYITFYGVAKVSWEKTRRQGRITTTTHYKSKEVYIDINNTVFGDGTLPAGNHTYNFHILLPTDCPSSCEGRYGRIRYTLRLKLSRPYGFDNIFKEVLTVVKPQDLNCNPALRLPLEMEDIFNSHYWFCSMGNINVKLTLPNGGYALDQSAKYSVHVQNQSMIDIKGYFIQFIRKITFTAHKPKLKTREDKTTVYEKSYDDQCLRLSTRIFDGTFPIGFTTPSTPGESIIKVEYLLKVTLNMAGCCEDKSISIPIYIGTIAMRESTENNTLIVATVPAPAALDEQHDLPPSYQDLHPSSEEKVKQ